MQKTRRTYMIILGILLCILASIAVMKPMKHPVDTFIVYTTDVDTYEKKELKKVQIQKDLPLEEQLNILGKQLSESQFESLPIEVLEIYEKENKKIARINLKDNEVINKEQKTWTQYLNSGSTGSLMTANTLKETFLQREYKGNWIDGVEFFCNGQPIPEMDHFAGTELLWR